MASEDYPTPPTVAPPIPPNTRPQRRVSPVDVHLDGTGKLAELKADTPHGLLTAITALPHGMASGAASVGLMVRMDDGSHVFAETSLRLLLTAATAFRARYGDEGNARVL